MKLDKSRKSRNIGTQGSPYAKASQPFMESSSHEPALIKAAGQENRKFTSSSMEALHKAKMRKMMEADEKRIKPDVAARMEAGAQTDKMTNVANAIRRAQGKGAISRNPFDKARGK